MYELRHKIYFRHFVLQQCLDLPFPVTWRSKMRRANKDSKSQTFCSIFINPYLLHFGNIQERHFWKKNPEYFFLVTILVTSYIDHWKYSYYASKQQGVFYLYHKYFKHVTSSSADIRVGFFFQEWRSWIFPVFGFFFQDSRIGVNKSWGTNIGHQHHNTPECVVPNSCYWWLDLSPTDLVSNIRHHHRCNRYNLYRISYSFNNIGSIFNWKLIAQ